MQYDFEDYDEYNDAEMSITGTASTPAQDRDNDFVNTAKIDLSNHKKNPVVMLDHMLTGHSLPIGRTENAKTGEYTMWYDEKTGKLKHKTFFNKDDEFSRKLYKMYRDKDIRGWSIAFDKNTAQAKKIPNQKKGFVIESCSLQELTACSVPSNPECLSNLKSIISQYRIVPEKNEKSSLNKSMEAMSAVDESKGGAMVGEEHEPYGHKCMKSYHNALKAVHEAHSDLSEHKHPDVKAHFEKALHQLKCHYQKTAQVHNELYPEEEQLEHEKSEENRQGEQEHEQAEQETHKSALKLMEDRINKLEAKEVIPVVQDNGLAAVEERVNKLYEKVKKVLGANGKN